MNTFLIPRKVYNISKVGHIPIKILLMYPYNDLQLPGNAALFKDLGLTMSPNQEALLQVLPGDKLVVTEFGFNLRKGKYNGRDEIHFQWASPRIASAFKRHFKKKKTFINGRLFGDDLLTSFAKFDLLDLTVETTTT